MFRSIRLAGDSALHLSSQQKRFLRGRTHHIKPVVIIGEKGMSENVMKELENALDHHELIKVKLRLPRQVRGELIAAIQDSCAAELVHAIGQAACFYRANPKKTVITLPQ